jgi:hypothetical protein
LFCSRSFLSVASSFHFLIWIVSSFTILKMIIDYICMNILIFMILYVRFFFLKLRHFYLYVISWCTVRHFFFITFAIFFCIKICDVSWRKKVFVNNLCFYCIYKNVIAMNIIIEKLYDRLGDVINSCNFFFFLSCGKNKKIKWKYIILK